MNQPDTRRILCVDDEPAITRALERCFQRQRWQVITSNNPVAYLEESGHQPVDLIISDYRMPDMSGVEFLTRMKTLQPDAMRIMLSAHADLEGVMQAINLAEVFRFMTKPWQDADLVQTVIQSLKLKDLTEENRKLADTMRRQQAVLNAQSLELQRLEQENPGITSVIRDQDGYIVLSGADDDA